MIGAITLSALLPAASCGWIEEPKLKGIAEPPIDFGSPETVFVAYRRALAKRNWKTSFEVLSPGQTDEQLFEILFQIGLGRDAKLRKIKDKYFDEEKLERRADAIDVNKVTPLERVRLVASCVTDRQRLFVEGRLRLDQVGAEHAAMRELRNVVRRGPKAKGTATYTTIVRSEVTTPDGKTEKRSEKSETEIAVYFVKRNGKWFVATRQEWAKAD